MLRAISTAALLLSLGASAATAQDLPRGTLIEEVKCLDDPAQGYALYLPSTYSSDRTWSLLIGFHPGARGRAIVEKYQAAAEQYGYIVAASNTSRNGPWSVSAAAVQAMSADLGRRFSIDAKRMYATGHSGGARVAMQIALTSGAIAGVIASSAGYPDSQPRDSVPFAVFGTAGSEDFNYIEMRMLDRKLTTPHRLAVFDGGHALPSDAVALEAVEWMELQAISSGRRARDESLIDRLIEKRRRQIDASTNGATTLHLLEALIADFKGLRDVAPETARLDHLSKDNDVKKAIARERADDDAEYRALLETFSLESQLQDGERHLEVMGRLKARLAQWAKDGSSGTDSRQRSQGRRLLASIASGARERVRDPEYLKIIEQYRLR